jgi:hypothetical protein
MAGAMIWMITAVSAATRMGPAGHAATSAGMPAILLAML